MHPNIPRNCLPVPHSPTSPPRIEPPRPNRPPVLADCASNLGVIGGQLILITLINYGRIVGGRDRSLRRLHEVGLLDLTPGHQRCNGVDGLVLIGKLRLIVETLLR